MTVLEKLRAWLAGYPGFGAPDGWEVDYMDRIGSGVGAFPGGLAEVERRRDIFGQVSVTNEYRFGLYRAVDGAVDAGWAAGFRAWVQEQSARGLAPIFGDGPERESVTTGDGVRFVPPGQAGAVHVIPITARFQQNF